MKISAKGQVTLPAAMRHKYGFEPGVEIELLPQNDGIQIKALKHSRKAEDDFSKWLSTATGCIKTDLSTDQMMRFTRGED